MLDLSRTQVLREADAGRLPVAMRLADGTRIFRRADVAQLAAERKRRGQGR